jgi:pimeloyl-ACP methyl ester carboxylesterase
MAFASVSEDVSLHYQDLGVGHPVILIHGGCMSHRVWESQVCTLLDNGYRVITPDLRGHGHSAKPVSPYTAEMYADDIASLMDALDVERAAVAGWSLGATIAATFACHHTARLERLLLTSSNIFHHIAPASETDGGGNRLPLQKMIDNQRCDRPQGMERFVSGMFATNADRWTVQWLWSIGMQTPMRVAVKTLQIYEEPETETIRGAIADLRVPVGVFHGGRDGSATVSEAESIATEIATDGTFASFDESGHVPFLEQPERFNDQLVQFLET